MSIAERFGAYAAAFEETYADDDWSRLEPFFTEAAVYEVRNAPSMGGRFEGRAAALEGLRGSVEALDRRFDERRVELVGTPEIGEDRFEMQWRATYARAGCPDLTFGGREIAVFEGDRISKLTDDMDEGTEEAVSGYVERYLAG